MRAYVLFFLVCVLFSSFVSAVECPLGFVWMRMSGVGCVQEDCGKVGASLSYTSVCFCRDESKKECRELVDYTAFDKKKCEAFCPFTRVLSCIDKNAKCPNELKTQKECDEYCRSYHNPHSSGTPNGDRCDCKCAQGYAPDNTLTCVPTKDYCQKYCVEYHGPNVVSKVVEDRCDCTCKEGYKPDNTLTCKIVPKASTTTTSSTTTTTFGLKTACNYDGKCDSDESMLSCCNDCGCPYNMTCSDNKCMFPDKEACKAILSQDPSFLGLRIPASGTAGAQFAEYDLNYDNAMLRQNIFDMMRLYQFRNGPLMTRPQSLATGPEEFTKLMLHLGSHTMSQSNPDYYKEHYYSGNEGALRQALADEYKRRGDRPLEPADVLALCLKLNKGVVYNAMLSCHNFLRGAARGNEDFSGQKLPDGSVYTTTASQDQKRHGLGDSQLSGEGRDPSIFTMLAPLRRTDNEGTWYHLFGTMVAGYAESEDVTGGTDTVSGAGLEFEHYYVKTNFDAIEYCWDVWGARLGADIYRDIVKPTPGLLGVEEETIDLTTIGPIYIPQIREGYK